ncbi:short-chain dehydrogenase/reductase family 16C member 6-like [Prorops nasuta]|uniref:short-chain dehydrogenase/reductase family 16C member 6-like n=1 Tax=Prorops nasuta TaxID=863751 RepID=UPI0034CE6A4E
MVPIREESENCKSHVDGTSSNVWFYLTIEFFIGIAISGFLFLLTVVKSSLPKPPRDLTGDVVLVAGASSSLGESLVEEFAKSGCSVICVDDDLEAVERIATRLASRYPRIEEVGSNHSSHGKHEASRQKPRVSAYSCNLYDRNAIREIARKIGDSVDRIDVLVTCTGNQQEDILDTASSTLLSHYWIVLAFLPSMMHRGRAHIVGITPFASMTDAYLGSRAAIAGLMESLSQEMTNANSQITFLTVAPKAEQRLIRQREKQVSKDIVEAVRRDQCTLSVSWFSKMLYQISCVIYNTITMITQWLHTQGCDYSF